MSEERAGRRSTLSGSALSTLAPSASRPGVNGTRGTPVLASRLRPPTPRRGVVQRTSVLDRIEAETDASVVAVVAPAGYGKTTLLHQWMARRGAPTAWLSLAVDDNDPTVLLTHLAASLQDVVRVDPTVFRELAVAYPSVRSIGVGLANALARADDPVTVVVDDAHLVANPTCHDILSLLVEQASPRAVVAAASREDLPVPIARLRAEGRVVEIGHDDLSMDPREASMLAAGAGSEVTDDVARDLVDETEGWPVALYLVARSVRRQGTLPSSTETGRRRSVVEYVRDEFLAGLDAEAVQFLTRSSVLARMSGPSCDAVTRTFGSAERLERYAHSNLLVIPLDDDRTWYRYHHVFHDLLRAELEHREPAQVPTLRGRAAAWAESQGLLDEAVEYAMAAGDVDRAARIVSDRGLDLYRSGRVATLERWFAWFDDGGHMADHPEIATAGAWMTALTGHAAAAERWATAADATRPRVADGDDGDDLDGLVDLMRATLCREGIAQAHVDVERAQRLLPIDHAWRPSLLTIAGVVRYCTGDLDGADRLLVEATDRADEAGAGPAHSVALAQRALVAVTRGESRAAQQLVSAGLDVVDQRRLQDHATNVFVYAVAARVVGGTGEAARTRELIGRAQRLRPRLNHSIPHLALQARLALAQALLTLGDGAGARTMVREIDELLRLRPGLGMLDDAVEALRPRLDTTPSGAVGASTLTVAELRVLPLLQTHLTFREIGGRLFVSPNTVKTQAISVYRKLGVTSRSDAVGRAVELGLVEP